METTQIPLSMPEVKTGLSVYVEQVGQQVVPVLRPEIYAPGRARCPRCRIEYLYHPILYPWCPGCCDRPE
jgi:hypothetical protein